VELPADIQGRLNRLKRGGMRITVAQYEYKSLCSDPPCTEA
jgi:hypothetical protein